MEIFFLCLMMIYLAKERICHKRRLNRIPIRIHVNGTRGKSSVVRLIAAALRRSGIRTLAKTTGTVPRLILPDGSEEIIRRKSSANILEQMAVIRRADSMKAEAIVIECMALDPALQFVSETEMVRSTVGVITNVRPDHFEVMGKNLDEVAEALSQSVPLRGVLVTGDRRYLPFFSQVASGRGSRAVLAWNPDQDAENSLNEIHLFRDNIDIVRSVCSLLGLDPAVTAQSIEETVLTGRDIGICRILFRGRTVHFVDAFSANDVESTRIIQERVLARNGSPRPLFALFNNRADRPLRMKSFVDDLLTEDLYDHVAVIGEGRHLAQRYLQEKIAKERIFVLPNTSPLLLLESLIRQAACPEFTIVGMGNEKGLGERISQFFAEAEAQ
ncbi:MAG: poly-gamma-glutamate synthase PgsB [Desulfobacteraceae bacterium]|nr:MAG: poly-gamma-glutamate synthase PgsB [Desulfobacteraceae bacterium]